MNLRKLKKAFSIIELIFVIVITSILGIAIANFQDNSLIIARDQFIKDIRKTQTLALFDNKFMERNSTNSLKDISRSKFWFKSLWQVQVSRTRKTVFYTIYFDTPTSQSGKYNFSPSKTFNEIAIDPLTRKLMFGNWKDDRLAGTYKEEDVNTKLNLSLEYGIDEVNFIFLSNRTSVRKNKMNIFFDNLGRPYVLKSKHNLTISGLSNNSDLHPFKYILKEPIQIKLLKNVNQVCFNLEPISGYLHIENCVF